MTQVQKSGEGKSSANKSRQLTILISFQNDRHHPPLKKFTWSEKIDLPQLFCELRTLPELHIKWKSSTKSHINEIRHLICGSNGTLHLKRGYSGGIVMTFCDMEMLHIHIKYVFDWKWSFPMQFCSFENFRFQFICNSGRVLNSQKSCGRSIFSLHMIWRLKFGKMKILKLHFEEWILKLVLLKG